MLSTTAFTLRLQRYAVTAVQNAKQASALAADRANTFACGVLIHTRQGDPAGRLVYRLLERAAGMPLLLVDLAGDLAPVRYADMVLYGLNTSMTHILAALLILSRPKSGSQPGSAA